MESEILIGVKYEQEREKRIKENRALLETLGFNKFWVDEPKLKLSPKPKVKKEKLDGEYEHLPPTRRSTRVQKEIINQSPEYEKLDISFYEESDSSDEESNPKPIKRLHKKYYQVKGTRTKNPGRRYQGGRVYDSVNGTTCHQCRQKTIEDKVRCTNRLADGELCRVMLDERCLLGRYGETLDQARDTGEWSCPKCRDVCNCSFCRIKKGLTPTGQLKDKALAKGFKSVMHFLGDTLTSRNSLKIKDETQEFLGNIEQTSTPTYPQVKKSKAKKRPKMEYEETNSRRQLRPERTYVKIEDKESKPFVKFQQTRIPERITIPQSGHEPLLKLEEDTKRRLKLEDCIDWDKFPGGVCVYIAESPEDFFKNEVETLLEVSDFKCPR
ncbi:hypothetical protein G9A89_002457 [Geosiphon pyriformis]|nr:hypothetical protein G9A89_002457 [Geosiphon pyriformis]